MQAPEQATAYINSKASFLLRRNLLCLKIMMEKEMETIKISAEFRAKLQAWVDEVAPKILANKKESPARNLPPKKEFNQCEAQLLQAGDRVKFGRYLNSKTWVVQGVRKQVYHPISPCVQSVIVTCRYPRTREIKQFSLPAERLIIREQLKNQNNQE